MQQRERWKKPTVGSNSANKVHSQETAFTKHSLV